MYPIEQLKNFAESINCPFTENEPMTNHTSFKIGGNADIALTPPNEKALSEIIGQCKKCEIPYYILGNGSNLLVSDTGIRGAVIFTSAFNDIEQVDEFTVKCGAGVKNSQLCSFALEHSLTGFEFLWGIPGTVGGAVYMNAGAYGGEIKDVFVSSQHIDDNGNTGEFTADDIDYSYRHSAYTDSGYAITSVLLRGSNAQQTEIRRKMDELMQRRKDKQPLEYPSAGSVFKRPQNAYAAALIEECGLKGASVGGAQVSEKHSGFIINTGGATASDVKILIEKIKQEVFLNKNITLECEIKILD